MQKVVLKLELHDNKEKKKAMKIVSKVAGVDSIDINLKDQKLTVAGTMDPVELVGKLRKVFIADIVSVGSAKADQKKDENKKDDQDKKSGKDSKADPGKVYPLALPYPYYPHHPPPPYYYGRNMSVEENPNGCIMS